MFEKWVVLRVFADKRGNTLIFPADMVQQNVNLLIQALQIFDRRAGAHDGVCRLTKLLFVIYMEGMVCIVVRIMVLLLQCFLVRKVLCNIVGKELRGIQQRVTATTRGAGVQQVVNGLEQLRVLGVDQLVAADQIRGKGIVLSTCQDLR